MSSPKLPWLERHGGAWIRGSTGVTKMPVASFNLTPFGLPGGPRNEVRFEEPRDIVSVEVELASPPPSSVGVTYLRKTWPDARYEEWSRKDPCSMGWTPQDDWFNAEWQVAATVCETTDRGGLRFRFQGLAEEFPDCQDYNVDFRRTLGVRIDGVAPEDIRAIRVYSASDAIQRVLRLQLDQPGGNGAFPFAVQAYNAEVERVTQEGSAVPGGFLLHVSHMDPVHPYCGDDGLLTFRGDEATFTVSLAALVREGAIRSEDFGVLLTLAGDPMRLADYRAANEGNATLAARVKAHQEQSLSGARYGQPRPHAVSYNLGCPYARQRFWLEPNGDMVLHKRNMEWITGRDTPRFACAGDARFYFGLEDWLIVGRATDPEPMLGYTVQGRRDGLSVEQCAFAVRLLERDPGPDGEGDDPVGALVRLRFRNESDTPQELRFPLRYAHAAGRFAACRNAPRGEDGSMVPRFPLDGLTLQGDTVLGPFDGRSVVRCLVQTAMETHAGDNAVVLTARLDPGAACEALVKIPYVEPTESELQLLRGMDFERCRAEQTAQWRVFAQRGARVLTPEPRLNALHRMHPVHIAVTDCAMPGHRRLINTSVGTSTYGNYSNESCMVVHDLDQRGLHDEARRRLEVWLKYQSTAEQPGNFTDYDGMFYGAAGFERGAYNQHHGWVLWCLCEHFFLTRDERWFRSVADAVLAGAEWVFRQRRQTLKQAPWSRGWERGFLPAGSLEDVTDFFYWLSTNSLTWRGTEWAARALEKVGHPEAARVRREADTYAEDLRRGFETARETAPLVRLRDGRWVPHYPSRLYRRGRETGWIRETLEGAVYLLISGLYDPRGREADWILDDFQDNRYSRAPFGYDIQDFETTWFDHAGFSIQPNLLAGLLPHLDRDEPELFIWMFFNAWAACYRDEINAMVEHPMQVLGYSNSAHFKSSDQANAMMWLRYMFVYRIEDELWLGRAVPRVWFRRTEPFGVWDTVTHFGAVSVAYHADPAKNALHATLSLAIEEAPSRIVLRFRHPGGLPIQSAEVNGRPHNAFDPASGNVDLTGMTGDITVRTKHKK